MSNEKKTKNKRLNRYKKLIKHKVFRARNLLFVLSLGLIITLYISTISISILQARYVVGAILILLFTTILSTILINVHKKKPLKAIGYLLMIATLLVSVDGIYLLTKTNQFLNNSFATENKHYQTTYDLIVLAEKSSERPEGTVGFFEEMSNKDDVLKNIENKYELNHKSYTTVDALILALLGNEVDCIVLDKNIYSNLTLNLNYESSLFKKLYEFDIYNRRKIDSKKLDKFNIYVEVVDENGHNKFNNIISMNTNSKKASVISISKDAYIPIKSSKTKMDKVENLNTYGDKTTIKSLENLLDTKIEYNVRISEKNLLSLIKKQNIKYKNFKLDTKEELDELIEDNEIIYLIEEIYDNLKKEYNPKEYNELLINLNSSYETNISKEQIYKIFTNRPSVDNKHKITGEKTSKGIYLSNIYDNAEEPSEESIVKARKIIEGTLN